MIIIKFNFKDCFGNRVEYVLEKCMVLSEPFFKTIRYIVSIAWGRFSSHLSFGLANDVDLGDLYSYYSYFDDENLYL